MPDSKPNQVFLFDMTRARSHLFFRFLSTHPDVQSYWHPYLSAHIFGPDRITHYTKNASQDSDKVDWDADLTTETYAIATENLLKAAREAEENVSIQHFRSNYPIEDTYPIEHH